MLRLVVLVLCAANFQISCEGQEISKPVFSALVKLENKTNEQGQSSEPLLSSTIPSSTTVTGLSQSTEVPNSPLGTNPRVPGKISQEISKPVLSASVELENKTNEQGQSSKPLLNSNIPSSTTVTWLSQSTEVPNSTLRTNLRRVPGKISKEKCRRNFRVDFEEEVAVQPWKDILTLVGGTPTIEHEFPHMALLGYQNEVNGMIEWKCGGALISEYFVLTAAHCITGRTKPPKVVRVDLVELSYHSNFIERHVIDTIPHPEYNSRQRYHDIGLIRIEHVHLNDSYPACLHTEKNIREKSATVTGWGYTDFFGPYGSDHLLKVELDLFTNEYCTEKYKSRINSTKSTLTRGIDDDLLICAGSTKEMKGACFGDSGGPLQIFNSAQQAYTVIGITSFGSACGLTKGIPDIFTRVSNYIEWIENIVWPEENLESSTIKNYK